MKGSAAFLKISDAGRHNTPCPTIFVVNLGLTCSEEELIPVFSRCRGFLKLKMHSTIGAPLAFVDFQVEENSSGIYSVVCLVMGGPTQERVGAIAPTGLNRKKLVIFGFEFKLEFLKT
ncbi:uncharacterized protein Fot_26654 [Forsythia ovata]|uniref:RRM domain-containing protein n=1 Tax=Forsythia ovata TaxID=205694 RepID=A0ABD1UCG7_9LAMI